MDLPKVDKKRNLLSTVSQKAKLGLKAVLVGSTAIAIGALSQPTEAKTLSQSIQISQFQNSPIPGKLVMSKMASSENLMFGHSSHYSHSSHSSHASHYSHYSSRF